MKNKVIAALVLSTVIISGLAALAVGGSAGDPLISLSYLTDTFLPQMTTQAETQAEKLVLDDYQAAQAALDDSQTRYAARAGLLGGAWSYCDIYERRDYKLEDVVRLSPGSGFLFLEGAASAVALGGELVDVTEGSATDAITTLISGHRYLASEDAVVSVTILSDAAYLAPQGYCSATLSEAVTLPFTDIVNTSWYYDYVHYVCNAGLFNGVTNTQFFPTASMTRAMLATVLYRQAGSPDTGGEQQTEFTDVAADSWYATPVLWAAGSGIVNGMGDSMYAPNNNVTREQMAVMLYRYAADYIGLSTTAAVGDLAVFTDADQSSDWARDALVWVVGTGIVGGRTDGTLDPSGTATRVEVAAMLQRFTVLLK